MADFGKSVALAGRRFVSFQVAAGTMGAVTRAFREGLAGAIEFDLQMNKLRQVSGDTAAQVKTVGTEIQRLAINFGASSSELAEAAVTLKQAGLATRDVKTALEGIAQASLAPNFSSMKQITEGAIAGFQQFGKEVRNIKEQLGAMNAVAGDFAVEASDLVTAVQKAGGTASQTGAQFNELLAIFTSVRATTRESADSISTGLRTIFTRLQRNDTVDSLRQLGVNLRYTRGEAEALGQVDMEGQFVGAYEAVRRLSEGLSKIRTTDPRFSSAIEELGGYRQVSRVIPMIQQFGEAQKALNVARLGSASLEAAAAARQDAIATKMAKTREEFQKFTNELVQSRGFKAMVDSVLTLATGLAKLLDVAKPLIPVLMTLGAVRLTQGLTQFGAGLVQGWSGALGGARPVAPRRFAIGGVVPGVGSGDTVPAQLEPGEFVIRKSSAQRIGYDALYALNAQRFNDGGRVGNNVVTPANINRLIREYQAKTGIDFRKGLGVTFTIGHGRVAGIKDTAYGTFNAESRKLVLNPKTITSIEQLRKTLAHELGHAVDTHFSGKTSGLKVRDLGSYRGGLLGDVAKDYRDQSLSLQELTGRRMSPQYAAYRLARHETFADAFRDHVTGDGRDARIDSITRQAALETGSSRFGRTLGWVRRRFMRFATGGTTDSKVDALLTPGEFVVDKRTAARLGPDALNRMNLYGDLPRFAMGGPVLRYATGGPGYDLNAIIMRVMAQVSGGGRGADERMSGAGERIARAVASGRIPSDPAQAEAFLLRAAGLGAKAADERERRYRTRERSGLVSQATGASVIDSAAAGANAGIPLSSPPPRGRGRESNAAVAERNAYQSREYQALQAIQASGLTGSAAEREFARLMAGPAATGSVVTPAAAAVFAPRPVAQTAAPGVLRAAAGRASLLDTTPPSVPPTPTGVAPSAPAPALLALPPYRGPATYGLVPDGALPVPASTGPGGAYLPNSYLLNAPTAARPPRTPLPAPIPFKDEVYDPRTVNSYAPLPTPPGGMHPAARMARRPGETADDYAYRVYSGDRPPTYRMTPTRVRAESVTDVAPAMPGFGAADVAALRTNAAVDARGGTRMLSTQTALEVQQKEHLRVEQELTKAIERQLRALYPAISATEARRMAEERARTALDRNETVLRNATGGVVGTAALGQQLQDAGKNPAGVVPFLGGGTFRERAATLGGRIARSFTPQGGMVGTYGLMMGAPMLGELVGPSQRSVQVAATTGNTFGAQVQGAGASALTMAAMGAGVGMTFGPMGAAIGAAAGGLVGLAQGFNQTAKDIREARLGTSLQRLGDMISAAANNVSGAGLAGMDPSALKQELGVAFGEAEQRTRDATTRSWWNPRRQADLTGLSADDLAAVRTKEVRAALGGQAGAMVSLLSRRAEDLGRANPDANPADLAKRLSSDSAAGPMLQAVAAVRGESVDKVVKEFAESIRGAQRQLRVQREVQAGRLAADQSAAALSRLTDAVTNAAGSVGRFETSMSVLGSVFSGQGGTGRVTSITGGFSSFGTGTGIEFRRSSAAVGAALGPAGSSLLKSAEAGDQLARVLPSVLATLGASPLGPDESYGKKTRDLLYAQLLPGMDDAGRARALESNPELARAIESAVGSVVRVQSESEGDGGLAKRLQQDAGRVATEVTEAFAGPLREAGERMARAVEDQSNKYVDGLASARQMLVTAGESLDRVGELRLAGARVGADVAADRTGRAATDILSLRDLLAPFIERQQRLTGLGADAENPVAIAARLRQVTGDVAGATAERDAAVGNRDRFAAAAGNLDRLVGTSNNLQTALRNLANASERAAGLQEKLTAATANRDSRLGYAEKYLFAGDEQRARMQRGQSLVIGLDRGRVGFNSLSQDEQRLAVETLGDFGQTRLASGRTAEGLRRQLLGSLPGVTDAGQEGERRGLQDQVVGVYRTAEEAQRALADNQRDLHGRFIADLRSLHEQFFARLATNLAAEQVGAARNGLASAEVTRGQLRREEQQRGVLARVGVTGQAGLQGLRVSEGDLRSFLDSTDRLNALRSRALGAGDTRAAIDTNLDVLASQLAGNLFSAPKGDRLREVLASRGLGDLSQGGQQAAVDYVTTQMSDRYGTVDGLVAWELKSRDEQVSYIEGLVRRGLEVGREHTAGEISRERDRAGDALRVRGVNTDALAALNTGDRSSLTEAVRTSATDLATLDARIRETEASMVRFKEQLDRAGAALSATSSAEGGAAVLRRADGGFTPRGTDTVPAMLTPGEFVINRASTQANLPLLREINAARGPVQYHQVGGTVVRGAQAQSPTLGQVADGYKWAADKLSQGLSWLGFSQGGVAYLAGGGLAEQYDRARLAASLAENSRGAERGALVGGGTAVLPALDAGQASYRAFLRRREAALARRLNPAAGLASKVVAMTPAEALAANRALNAQNMAFSQAIARSGMDEGQPQAALGSLAQRRDYQNRVFLDRFGASTAAMRMRNTQGWAAGASLRSATSAAPAATIEAARRIREAFARDARRHSSANRIVSPVGSPNTRFFVDGGFVGGSGTGDTVPALLSPGEFVFSRPAVSALGAANLNRVHRFATGGIVPGGSAGGGPGASGILGLSQEARTAMDQFAGHSKDLGVALTGFAAPANLLVSALQGFNAGAEKLAGALEKFKGEVSHTFNGNLVVDLNGAEALNALKGELQTDLTSVVMRQVVDYVGQMFPDAPKPPGVGPAGY